MSRTLLSRNKLVVILLLTVVGIGYASWRILRQEGKVITTENNDKQVSAESPTNEQRGSVPTSSIQATARDQAAPNHPQEPQHDMSGLDLGVGTNATLLLEDPSGRRTGRDPATNSVLQEIPHSAYFEDAIDNSVTGERSSGVNHLIEISKPSEGTYRLTLIGLEPGAYELTFRAFSKDGSDQSQIQKKGEITSRSRIMFQIDFTSAPGGRSILRMSSN